MNELEGFIAALEQQPSLHEPDNLYQRIEALDLLEACFPALEQGAGDFSGPPVEAALLSRASAIRQRLEAENHRLFQSTRLAIQRGTGPGQLLHWVAVLDQAGKARIDPAMAGYDFLDVLLSGVLQFEEPGAAIAGTLPEMVFYQPTAARHALDFIARAALDAQDVLVDLGSGLGHVPLLASICTGVTSIGIEREPAYVHCAQQCARALNLANVTFIQQDARQTDFSRGTVFYLYTPFTGTILRAVLDLLRRESAVRDIRIGTFGPCTATVAGEPWLQVVGPLEKNRVAIFRARTPASIDVA